jgi:hypothetical protein
LDSWGSEQSWSFWLGRRNQAATNFNYSVVWLWANESDFESTTVDGYRVRFGDDSGDDNIVLQRVDNNVVATEIITSSGTVPNGLTDIGFMVRVTRTTDSVWTLYTSTLPTLDGEGAIATDFPTAAQTSVDQGSETDATYTDFSNGYLGVMAVHSSGNNPRTGAEFDQFYFDTDSDSSLPVNLSFFTAIPIDSGIELKWRTESEVDNLGWDIYRGEKQDGEFIQISDKLIPGAGNSAMPNSYRFIDGTALKDRQYYYYLEDVDVAGMRHKSPIIPISPEAKTLSATWAQIKNRD